MEEIWKPVKDFEDKYEISNMGRVKSLQREVRGISNCKRIFPSKILKQSNNGYGYYIVNLCKNNKPKISYVHRLVAQAFIPNPDNLPEVNHKDENKANNCVDNLEWCTSKYNANYGTRNERFTSKKREKYSKMVVKKNLEDKTIEIIPMYEAVKQKGVHYASLIRTCKGLNKTCAGYKWEYYNE